jgi:hypothetical protein
VIAPRRGERRAARVGHQTARERRRAARVGHQTARDRRRASARWMSARARGAPGRARRTSTNARGTPGRARRMSMGARGTSGCDAALARRDAERVGPRPSAITQSAGAIAVPHAHVSRWHGLCTAANQAVTSSATGMSAIWFTAPAGAAAPPRGRWGQVRSWK